ncbi:hypothetical protein COB72_09595, partial [bacterium]
MKQLSFINRRRKGALAIAASVLALGVASSANAQCNSSLINRVVASDGVIFDRFGVSVVIQGDRAVIGARRAEQSGVPSGGAYVFERIAGQWVQQFKLGRVDQADGDEFGSSVAMDGNTIVVGVPHDDDYGNDSGSVYVYTSVFGFWFQQAKLLADDGMEDDFFGSSVAISGDTIVVGAHSNDHDGTNSGAAYVYTRSGGVWTQRVKLSPSDAQPLDHFGAEVFIKGNLIAVGATGLSAGGSDGGAVYMYSRSVVNGTWTQGATLIASNTHQGNGFGTDIAMGTNSMVIGSSLSDEGGGFHVGAAHVFTTNDGGDTWTLQAKLIADDGLSQDSFGDGVAISEDDQIIVVGAPHDDTALGLNSGSAYIFTRVGGGFIQREKLLPFSAPEFSGFAVSLDGGSLVIGARAFTGQSYFYDLNCSTCPADINGDGGLNFFDVAGFLNLFNANDPVGDYN